jgi:hypothetical protein
MAFFIIKKALRENFDLMRSKFANNAILKFNLMIDLLAPTAIMRLNYSESRLM